MRCSELGVPNFRRQIQEPSHTLLLQASEDLRIWTTISTATPNTATNWQFLDANAPSFNKRFYRAAGQSK
jgi:hypothetical protein